MRKNWRKGHPDLRTQNRKKLDKIAQRKTRFEKEAVFANNNYGDNFIEKCRSTEVNVEF